MTIETIIIRIFGLPIIALGTWLMIRGLGKHHPAPPLTPEPKPEPIFEIAEPIPNDEDFEHYYRVSDGNVTRGRLERI